MDCLALCLAARNLPEVQLITAQAAEDGGLPLSTALGGALLPPAAAALVNGTAAHALGLDDFHAPTTVHPMVTVVPAALAASEAAGASGLRFLTAVVFGYEVTCRLGTAVRRGAIHQRGFHPTSVLGTVGAAAAAAFALGLDEEQTAHAMAISASRAAGLFQFAPNAWTKPLQAGWAASAGVWAAQIARRGFSGPADVLEGKSGLLYAFAGEGTYAPLPDREAPVEWMIDQVAFKPYAHGTDLHTAVDALLEILDDATLAPEAIERIEVHLPPHAHKAATEDVDGRRPRSLRRAQRNVYFTLAAAACAASTRVAMDTLTDWFRPERLSDPKLLAVADRIEAYPDPKLTATDPLASPASVTVHTGTGLRLHRTLHAHRGSPWRPFVPSELKARFCHLASGSVWAEPDLTGPFAELVELPSVKPVARILAGERP